MRYTADGTWVRPRWVAWMFGGTFRQKDGYGYGWTPSAPRLLYRYYAEGWYASGYTLREWMRLDAL